MAQIDLEHDFSALEQQLITAATTALVMNLQQMEEWIYISNAIAAATAEMLMRCDISDAVRLEMVDELAQGIRVNLLRHTGGMTKQ